MAISRRLRFEILRRDNYTCRYCGASAPDVKIRVDHVVPVALGGSDDPSNLVAACFDCNSGKSSIGPDSALVENIADDALRWSAAMRQVADAEAADRTVRDQHREAFQKEWQKWTYPGRDGGVNTLPLPNGWPLSIDRFIQSGLTDADIADAVDIAMRQEFARDEWRYFCGVCWGVINRRQSSAVNILGSGDAQASRQVGAPQSADQVLDWLPTTVVIDHLIRLVLDAGGVSSTDTDYLSVMLAEDAWNTLEESRLAGRKPLDSLAVMHDEIAWYLHHLGRHIRGDVDAEE